MDPSGKVCAVTGGAQGLGKEVAKHLLQRGAKVCILDVSPECGQTTAEEFQSQYGKGNAMFIQCDVTNKDNLEEAFSKVVSDFGGLDILFNNAGTVSPKEIILKVNLQGAIDAMESAISRMRTDAGGNGGIIVCTSSLLGLHPSGLLPEYHASKAGLIGYTRSRALECGNHRGIQFRIIAPTAIETNLLGTFFQSSPVPVEEIVATCSDEDKTTMGLDQAARAVMLSIEKKDLPQGALIKIVKDGNFLMHPEKMPFEKLLDP